MRQTISETQGVERLRTGLYAGAATVGRPKGIDGKKMSPRRAKMTTKEVDKLKSGFPDGIKKPLTAGGPGSGRRSSGQKDHKEDLVHSPKKNDYGQKVLGYKGYTIHKMNNKNAHGNFGTMEKGKPQSWGHPKLSNAKQFVRADTGEEDYAM